MRPARLLLAFLFMALWFGLLAHFSAFFRSSRLAPMLMAYVFLFAIGRWDKLFRRPRSNDEIATLKLNSNVNHG